MQGAENEFLHWGEEEHKGGPIACRKVKQKIYQISNC
jgi:hypothetical protein